MADGWRRFFVTLEACPHLNGKHTVFGRLVSGQDTLDKIARVDVDNGDRPLEPVLIARCGELEKRNKKKAAPAPESLAHSNSADRGRRRKSDGSDDEMKDSAEPEKTRRSRRKSDNLVDEGLRGRPRQRSGARSVSQALSTPSEQEEEGDLHSPVKKHKRKRSPSPSRHLDVDHRDGEDYERRRRRSLPNQYGDERYNRNYGDEDRYKPTPRRDDHRYAGGRRDDRYRPARDHYGDDGRLNGDGRLGGGGYDDGFEPPVKFKGRGVMKYREPGRL